MRLAYFVPSACAPRATRWHREMDRLFQQLGGFPASVDGASSDVTLTPRTEIVQANDYILVALELPGVAEQDIDVELNADTLTVRATKKSTREQTAGSVYRSERQFGTYERILKFDAELDRDRVSASFQNGVLEVTLPKQVTSPAVRKVAINGNLPTTTLTSSTSTDSGATDAPSAS